MAHCTQMNIPKLPIHSVNTMHHICNLTTSNHLEVYGVAIKNLSKLWNVLLIFIMYDISIKTTVPLNFWHMQQISNTITYNNNTICNQVYNDLTQLSLKWNITLDLLRNLIFSTQIISHFILYKLRMTQAHINFVKLIYKQQNHNINSFILLLKRSVERLEILFHLVISSR